MIRGHRFLSEVSLCWFKDHVSHSFRTLFQVPYLPMWQGRCGLVSVKFVTRARGDRSTDSRPGSCTLSKQPLPQCPSGQVALESLGHRLSRGAVRGAQVLPEQA